MSADPQLDTIAPSPLEASMKALGQALREGRQRRGCSLEELSRRLHMGMEQLQALEEGELARLPELVFVIAHSRRIASSLELSVDEQIEALRQCHKSLHAPASPARATAARATVSAAPTAAAQAASAGAVAANGIGGAFAPQPPGERVNRHGQALREASLSVPVSNRTWLRPLMALTLLGGVASGAAVLWRPGARVPMDRPPQAAAVRRPVAPVKAPAAVVVGSGEVLLQPLGRSWLEVRSGRGQRLHYGLLKREQRFPIADGLMIRSGRPDLIQLRTDSRPARVLGRVDDQVWWRIRPDGRVQVLPATPD